MDLRSIAASAANIIWAPISSTFSRFFSFLTGCFWNPASSDDVSFEGREMEILHPAPERSGASVSFAPPPPILETPAGKLQKEFIQAKLNFLNHPKHMLHESKDNKNLILLFIQVHVETEHQSKLIEKLEQVPSAQYLWIAQRLIDAELASGQINHIYILNVISKYIPHSISEDIIKEIRSNHPASRVERAFIAPPNKTNKGPVSPERPEPASPDPISPVLGHVQEASAAASITTDNATEQAAVTATNFADQVKKATTRIAESEIAGQARVLAGKAGRAARDLWDKMRHTNEHR